MSTGVMKLGDVVEVRALEVLVGKKDMPLFKRAMVFHVQDQKTDLRAILNFSAGTPCSEELQDKFVAWILLMRCMNRCIDKGIVTPLKGSGSPGDAEREVTE